MTTMTESGVQPGLESATETTLTTAMPTLAAGLPPGISWAEGTGDFVGGLIADLQRGYVRGEPTPASRAALAMLRRGLGKPPDKCPELAQFYVNPDLDARGDEPTPAEWAAHVATGLYALHQQSDTRNPMHVPATTFGTALGRLWRKTGEPPVVLDRFRMIGTATSLPELVHHARGMVQLLRREDIGFDYHRFAEDLVRFQNPALVASVRLGWGRDFYRVRPVAAAADGGTPAIGTPADATQ